jgi:lipid A 3-O-deacylase
MRFRFAAGVAVTLGMMLFANASARAQDHVQNMLYGLRVGVLAHDVNNVWSRSRSEGGFDMNAEVVFNRPSVSVLSGRILPNIGASVNNQKDTSKVYAGVLWEFLFGSGFFANTGVGLAVHDGDIGSMSENSKQLGSRFLFRVPFEFGISLGDRHRLSIMFDHISNGYLATPNEGLDTIGLRYGFQF